MYNFKFADIGEGIHEGQLLKWFFKVGDKINEGETLCLVETDKVNAEIPSPVTGIITKLGAKEGDIITVGSTLAIIDDGSEGEGKTSEQESGGVVGEIEVSDEVIEPIKETKTEEPKSKILASPLARKLAADLKIDLSKVKGTGEHNRILKADIEAYRGEPPKHKEVLSGTKISRTRKAIVEAMTLSKKVIPHSTLMNEIDVTKLANFRKEQKALAEKQNLKLTFMPFIIKAITLTIKKYPIFNARFNETTEEIIYQDQINIGIAIDTNDGLVVPNIKNADQKSILGLAKELSSLKKAAQEKTLQLSQIQNGTFTITNYGSLSVSFGTPIIKYPELAIIGIGKIAKKPIVIDDEIKIADILPVSLSFDHRIIDGADVGRFLIEFEKYINDPMLLLLS